MVQSNNVEVCNEDESSVVGKVSAGHWKPIGEAGEGGREREREKGAGGGDKINMPYVFQRLAVVDKPTQAREHPGRVRRRPAQQRRVEPAVVDQHNRDRVQPWVSLSRAGGADLQ